MITSVEVAILGVLVTSDEHTIEGVVVLVGDLLLVVDVGHVGGVVENVFLQVGVGGVEVHELEVLVASVEVSVFGVFVTTDEHAVEGIVVLVGNFLLVMNVSDIGGIIEDVFLQVSVGGIKFLKLLEVLITGVEIAVLSVFVSADEHTVKSVVMFVGDLLLVVDVSHVSGIVENVLLEIGVGGVELLELLEVLVSGVEVSILGVLVSSDEHAVQGVVVLVGDLLLVVDVGDIGGVVEDIFLQVGVGGVKVYEQHF